MKKALLVFSLLAVLSAPAMAAPRDDDARGVGSVISHDVRLSSTSSAASCRSTTLTILCRRGRDPAGGASVTGTLAPPHFRYICSLVRRRCADDCGRYQ